MLIKIEPGFDLQLPVRCTIFVFKVAKSLMKLIFKVGKRIIYELMEV